MLASPLLNEGLRRRFGTRVVFLPFSPEDAKNLLIKIVAKKELQWEAGPLRTLKSYLADLIGAMGSSWASAGTVVELSKALEKAAAQRHKLEGTPILNQAALDQARARLLHNLFSGSVRLAAMPPEAARTAAAASSNTHPPTPTIQTKIEVKTKPIEEEKPPEQDAAGGGGGGDIGTSEASEDDEKKFAHNRECYEKWEKILQEAREKAEAEQLRLKNVERLLAVRFPE